MNISNCYEKCEYYYYFNESNEFQCTQKCQGYFNKAILNKSKCIDDCKNDKIYKYDFNNICYRECPNGTFQNEIDFICYQIKNIETTIINEIHKSTDNK